MHDYQVTFVVMVTADSEDEAVDIARMCVSEPDFDAVSVDEVE